MEQYLVEIISAVAGAVLALAFEWFPGLSAWFNGVAKTTKQLIIAGSMLAVAVGMFGLGCAGLLGFILPDISLSCDVPGGLIVFRAFLAALGSAQTIHITVNKLIKAV